MATILLPVRSNSFNAFIYYYLFKNQLKVSFYSNKIVTVKVVILCKMLYFIDCIMRSVSAKSSAVALFTQGAVSILK